MKKFVYSKNNIVEIKKRFYSSLFDFIVLIVLVICSTLATVNISKNGDSYKINQALVDSQIEKLNVIVMNANLKEYDEEKKDYLSFEDMYKKYAIGHILLSFDNNIDYFKQNGVEDLHNKEGIKDKYESISIESDYIASFYACYLPLINLSGNYFDFMGKEPLEYYKNRLISQSDAKTCFNLTLDYPTLLPNIALDLYNFIFVDPTNNNTKIANISLGNIFSSLYQECVHIITKFDFYATEYDIYQSAYQQLINLINLDFVLAFFLSIAITNLILPLILGEGRTLGKLVTKSMLSDKNESKVKIWSIFGRFLVDFVSNYFIIFIGALTVTGTNPLMLSLFNIGSFSVNMMLFVAISLIYVVVNGLFTYFKKEKSITDLISHSMHIVKEIED